MISALETASFYADFYSQFHGSESDAKTPTHTSSGSSIRSSTTSLTTRFKRGRRIIDAAIECRRETADRLRAQVRGCLQVDDVSVVVDKLVDARLHNAEIPAEEEAAFFHALIRSEASKRCELKTVTNDDDVVDDGDDGGAFREKRKLELFDLLENVSTTAWTTAARNLSVS